MFFLAEYDRFTGGMKILRHFDGSLRVAAEDARLALELELQRTSIEREVVLLEAGSEQALHKTHRRYFDTSETLARAIAQAPNQPAV